MSDHFTKLMAAAGYKSLGKEVVRIPINVRFLKGYLSSGEELKIWWTPKPEDVRIQFPCPLEPMEAKFQAGAPNLNLISRNPLRDFRIMDRFPQEFFDSILNPADDSLIVTYI